MAPGDSALLLREEPALPQVTVLLVSPVDQGEHDGRGQPADDRGRQAVHEHVHEEGDPTPATIELTIAMAEEMVKKTPRR